MTPVPMVGRAAELAELVRRWSHVSGGGPAPAAVVSITGAAGVGKSRLVTSVLAALSPGPAAVLYGVARVHTPAPYDWLAAVLSGRDTHALPVPADGLAWLAQDPHAPSERYAPGALLRLAVRTVRALVGAGPAVLVVEDLHALDPASLNLVGELAAAPDLPALLLVTSRPPETADSPELVARTLARLSGAPGRYASTWARSDRPTSRRSSGRCTARSPNIWPGRSASGPAATRTGWSSCSRRRPGGVRRRCSTSRSRATCGAVRRRSRPSGTAVSGRRS
ncbi:ATP-binding protein [Catellatospora coxensis]